MEIKDSNNTIQAVMLACLLAILGIVFWYAGGTDYVADHVSAAEAAWSQTDETEPLTDRLSDISGVEELFDTDEKENVRSETDEVISDAEEELDKAAEEKSDET